MLRLHGAENFQSPGNRARRGILLLATLAAISGGAKAADLPPGPLCPSNISYLPTWNILTDKGFLCFVGSPPVQPGTSIIMTPVVPVILHFLNANNEVAATSDPTQPLHVNPSNSSGLSALGAVVESPIFQGYNFKMGSTSLGNLQWGQAVEEASFWKYPGVNFKDWIVIMAAVPSVPATLKVPYGSWSTGPTPHSFYVDAKVLDGFVDTQMATIPTGQVPIFLTYNISEYPHGNPSGCCVWGWHNTYQHTKGIYDAFIYATYLDAGVANSDLLPLSHEVAEFVHDPFGNNNVQGFPLSWTFALPWAPPYSFTKCQTNLEVGDPVEDRLFADPSEMQLPLTNSTMKYNFQNVVTASWLMQASPSFSVNGWYTLKGAVDGEFAGPAPKCPGVLK